MPSTSLRELFEHGAEYIFGGLRNSPKGNAGIIDELAKRFAAEGLNPSPGTFRLFVNIAERGFQAAQRIQSNVPITFEDIPVANIGNTSRPIATVGLARIGGAVEGGGREIQASIPFTFYDIEIINYESILDRIRRSISEGLDQSDEYYKEDITRIERLIDIARIRSGGIEAKADLWTVIQHGE